MHRCSLHSNYSFKIKNRSHFCLEGGKGHQHNVLCCDGKRSLVFDIPLVDFPSNKESHCVFSVRGNNTSFSNKKWFFSPTEFIYGIQKSETWEDFKQEEEGCWKSYTLSMMQRWGEQGSGLSTIFSSLPSSWNSEYLHLI